MLRVVLYISQCLFVKGPHYYHANGLALGAVADFGA